MLVRSHQAEIIVIVWSVLSKDATTWPGCGLNPNYAIRFVVKTKSFHLLSRHWPVASGLLHTCILLYIFNNGLHCATTNNRSNTKILIQRDVVKTNEHEKINLRPTIILPIVHMLLTCSTTYHFSNILFLQKIVIIQYESNRNSELSQCCMSLSTLILIISGIKSLQLRRSMEKYCYSICNI